MMHKSQPRIDRLFKLSKLLREANRHLGWAARLYEAGVIELKRARHVIWLTQHPKRRL